MPGWDFNLGLSLSKILPLEFCLLFSFKTDFTCIQRAVKIPLEFIKYLSIFVERTYCFSALDLHDNQFLYLQIYSPLS